MHHVPFQTERARSRRVGCIVGVGGRLLKMRFGARARSMSSIGVHNLHYLLQGFGVHCSPSYDLASPPRKFIKFYCNFHIISYQIIIC